MCDTGRGGAASGGATLDSHRPHTPRRVSRRRFLAGLAGAASALPLAGPAGAARAAFPRPRREGGAASAAAGGAQSHLAWAWHFQDDEILLRMRETLAGHGLGIILKTHDGGDWMSNFDSSVDAVTGPRQVSRLAAFFENGGVPFHAWYNARGDDPAAEAAMAADVLDAGARSLFIDLEAHYGFWRGAPADALRLGEALRRRQPRARITTSIDPRPWEIGRVPLAEFASFTDAIAPQVYWGSFRDGGNLLRFRAEGHDPGGVYGITPRFVLAAALPRLAAFGLPIHPVGDGAVDGTDGWPEFLDESFALDAGAVSVWRLGNVRPGVLRLLRDRPPRPAAHVVQPGDNLTLLAERWGVSVEAIMAANGIADPDRIRVGQRIAAPGALAAAAGPPAPAAYAIEAGDNLTLLAERWGVSVEAIMAANGIADPDRIHVGQEIAVPGRGAAPPPPAPAPASYAIEAGDNLTLLAERWGVSVEAIMAANGIADPDRIHVGQEIAVPGRGAAPPPPAPAPRATPSSRATASGASRRAGA